MLCIEMKPKPDTKTEQGNPLYGKFDQAVKALVTPKPKEASRPPVAYQSTGSTDK